MNKKITQPIFLEDQTYNDKNENELRKCFRELRRSGNDVK